MYEKIIEHFGLDEIGSNFTKDVYNPHGFKATDYYDKLAEAQKMVMDKYNKDQQTVQKGTDLADRKSRKSKWDTADGGGGPSDKRPKALNLCLSSDSFSFFIFGMNGSIVAK